MPWASEMPIRASGTCRSPHSPRSWRTTSIVCIPDGWVQWLFDSSPPSVLHGIDPPSRVWPSLKYAAPSPSWQKPISSRSRSMVMVKQSYRPPTSMSSRLTPAIENAMSAVRRTALPSSGNHGTSIVV